jgi:hypothetical protein
MLVRTHHKEAMSIVGRALKREFLIFFIFLIKITPRIGREMLKNMPNNARIMTISLEQY